MGGRLVPSLNSLPSAFALLCLLACSSGAQSIEEEGAQLGKDITAAIVQPIGSRSAPPPTLVIDRCEVTIEFKYAYSCSEPSGIGSERAFFNLNDVAYIDLIETSDQSLLLFTYWPEVKQVRQAGSNIIRSMYAISPYPADDLALNLLITDRVGEFLGSSTISVRSYVTYCSGASRPSFYPTDSAQVFIAQAEARVLGKRLGAFIQDNCREETGD